MFTKKDLRAVFGSVGLILEFGTHLPISRGREHIVLPVLVHKNTKNKTENSGAKSGKKKPTKALTVKDWFTTL